MSRQTREAGSSVGRAGVRAAVFGAVAGVAFLPAVAAHASVIGIGNTVSDVACDNSQSDTLAVSSITAAASGFAGGNLAGLPLNLPRNHCGNSGIVCTAVFGASV